ncbi:MAG: DegV family protein [Thermotoga sp.]|nr:DegV family protein [Thermotogota bacterium]RKX56344.1 MAG: DegV family protein [Thermotoga sp.]
MAIRIVSDSACDIPEDMLKKYDITTVPLYVHLSERETYREWQDLDIHRFYDWMENSTFLPKTSQPSPTDFTKAYEPFLKNGDDIISIHLSSGFSGTFQSAYVAKEMLKAKYPNARIEVIDSRFPTIAEGYPVLMAAEYVRAGKKFDEVVEASKEVIKHTYAIFTVASLKYLQMGGRIGKAASLIGGILNFKPILAVENGEVGALGKVRGRKESLRKIVIESSKRIKEPENTVFAIAHADAEGDARYLESFVREQFGYSREIKFIELGTTITTHTGPGTVALCFCEMESFKPW